MMDVTEFLEQNSSDSTSNNHRATSSSTMKRPRVAKVTVVYKNAYFSNTNKHISQPIECIRNE
jgi:hypothetical protein